MMIMIILVAYYSLLVTLRNEILLIITPSKAQVFSAHLISNN